MRLLREARSPPSLWNVLEVLSLIVGGAPFGVDMLLLEVGMCLRSEKLNRIEL